MPLQRDARRAHAGAQAFQRNELERQQRFHIQRIQVTWLRVAAQQNQCIAFAFAFAGATPKGDMVCAFTGVLRACRSEAVWHVLSDRATSGEVTR